MSKPTTPESAPTVRRQSKLQAFVRNLAHVGNNNHTAASHSSSSSSNSKKYATAMKRSVLESQASYRIQNAHHDIMKRIEATTHRARNEMEDVRKDCVLKENKVREEIERLVKELDHIEMEGAKRIRAIQDKEAAELEKLVKELKSI